MPGVVLAQSRDLMLVVVCWYTDAYYGNKYVAARRYARYYNGMEGPAHFEGSWPLLNGPLERLITADNMAREGLYATVFLLMLVLTCCGQDGADGSFSLVFPDPGLYDSATESEWIFDANWYYGNYFNSGPNYPIVYTPYIQWLFYFEAPENEVVEVMFNPFFSIEPSSGCKYDYLEIRDGRFGFSPLISRLCGDQSPGNVTSSGRYLWILFVTDEDLEYAGFEAFFRFIPAPRVILPQPQECFFRFIGAYDGEFSIKMATDLLRADDKHAPIDCTWQIDMPEVNKIMIKFDKFEMNNINDCDENRIMIYDKYSYHMWMIREYCSTTAPAAMSISNRMFVRFVASNRSAYNNVEMMYTAYTDKPCIEKPIFPCGPYICLNMSLVCNGRQNCWNYPFDEEKSTCQPEPDTNILKDVNIALAVTMAIILTVTVVTVVVTCRHSCLRTRNKAKTMASRRIRLNQQVQILMDGENVELREMTLLGDNKKQHSSTNGKFPASGTGSIADGAPRSPARLSNASHDFPMTATQLKEYERIMDSELGYELRQNKRTSLMEPDSPWVRANQYNESFRKSAANPFHPNKDIQVHF